MPKRKKTGTCTECDLSFEVKVDSKEPISFCPFCGEEAIDDIPKPLLNTFEDMDEFEDEDYFESIEDDYEDDE